MQPMALREAPVDGCAVSPLTPAFRRAHAHASGILANLDLITNGKALEPGWTDTPKGPSIPPTGPEPPPSQSDATALIDRAKHIYLLISKTEARELAQSGFRCILRGDRLYITHRRILPDGREPSPSQSDATELALIDRAKHIYKLILKPLARELAQSSAFRCTLRDDRLYISHLGTHCGGDGDGGDGEHEHV